MLRSILVGLDGSDHSEAALELAARWAERYEALVVGLAIVDEPSIRRPEPVPIGGGAFKRERDEELLADATRRAGDALDHFAQFSATRGLKFEAVQAVGSPAAEIVKLSKRHDLIALGQQSYFCFETQDCEDDTLWQVLRKSVRPVVAVPIQPLPEGAIVVAYNGTPEADRALAAFQALQLETGGAIHVVCIDSDIVSAERCAAEAVAFLRVHHIQAGAHGIEPVDSVAGAIVKQVEELGAGLLVMGACGRARWRELVFGSTTAEVLQSTPVPVFLYR